MNVLTITSWCDRIIRLSFYLLFILVPLILTPWNYELFEFNKMMVTYALTVIITGAWILKIVANKELRVARTPLDIPIIIFFISQFISTLFSIDPHVSWLGYYSRFNGGMWSVISYVLLYYAFVSNWNSIANRSVLPLLKVIVLTAVVVALYGVLERLGIDKHLWVQDVQNRVFSTLGQPNWLAAYLVALFPLSLALAKPLGNFRSLGNVRFIFWYLISLLLFIVLLFTRSRSGLLGLAISDILFWTFFYFNTEKREALKIPFLLIHISLVLVVFLNGSNIEAIDRYFSLKSINNAFIRTKTTTPTVPENLASPGPLLEVGGTESGKIRKYVWQGAITAWRSSTKVFFLGTGTETFAFAFFQYRPKEHNLTSEWDFLYNKAHNEYLNYLTTTGIIGLGTYVLLLGVFIIWFIKSQIQRNDQELDTQGFILPHALMAGWASVLVTNFFGFSVVVTQLVIFLFPAMIFVTMLNRSYVHLRIHLPSYGYKLATWTTFLICLFLLYFLSTQWYADKLFTLGYRLNRSANYTDAKAYLASAVTLNPTEPFYHDELASAFSGLAVSAMEQKDATGASEYAKQSFKESDIALAVSAKNVNFWKTRTKIYYSLSTFNPILIQAAIEALNQAKLLSPNDPKIDYNLAVLYGRDGNNAKAITYLQSAMSLKPNYRDAYYALYVFYTDAKRIEEAKTILSTYLKLVDPKDSEFLQLVGASGK